MSKWEDTFKKWSQGPSKSETERCENAIRMIKDAIQASTKLKTREVGVYLQGSYRNRVNVRKDSDVDVGIVCKSVFYPSYPEGTSSKSFGNADADYGYPQFKNEVEEALVDKFGRDAVTRSNKAIDIKANSYRVDADVVPVIQHRRYNNDGTFLEGVQLFSDDEKKIINWPEQHYNNGVSKNTKCNRRYKRVVRILKKLAIEMESDNIDAVKAIPGFLCECLIWNVSDNLFGNDTYNEDLHNSLLYLYEKLGHADSDEWGEVSELKYLFSPSQKWTKQNARNFVIAAWNYVGF